MALRATSRSISVKVVVCLAAGLTVSCSNSSDNNDGTNTQITSAGCEAITPAPVSGVYQFTDDDLTRTYRIHIPTGYEPAKPTPLALVFHGWGGDENEFLAEPAVTDEADARNFILVAPRGVGSEVDESFNSWSFRGSASGIGGDGLPVCDEVMTTDYTYPSCGPVGEGVAKSSCSWTQCQTDDISFVNALVEEVAKSACIDTDRVFATGGSNGGMFTWELGQNASTANSLRAIAPLIGLPHRGYLDGPGRDDGLPVLLVTGQDDPTVPPGTWEDASFTTSSDGDFYYYTGAAAITQTWATAQGCPIDEPAQALALGGDGVDCRSYCATAESGELPPVLDCRVDMAHEYQLDRTWPLILEFFESQPPR